MTNEAPSNWVEQPAGDVADAVVGAMTAGGVDHLFFTSGSEIGFYQEATSKAKAQGRKTLNLITVPLEHVSLNAALGFAAVSGRRRQPRAMSIAAPNITAAPCTPPGARAFPSS